MALKHRPYLIGLGMLYGLGTVILSFIPVLVTEWLASYDAQYPRWWHALIFFGLILGLTAFLAWVWTRPLKSVSNNEDLTVLFTSGVLTYIPLLWIGLSLLTR